MRRRSFEVVVVGAGPVGLLFASRLARGPHAADLRIRVVDAQTPPAWDRQRVDARVYALSRESQIYLASVWQRIEDSRASPYRRMRVWSGKTLSAATAIDFDCAMIGEPNLGHIIEDSLLRRALLDELADTEVRVSLESGLIALEPNERAVRLMLDDGTSIAADLVVGADGLSSKVRSAAGIESFKKSYAQRAIVTHVATSAPHAETAWQRFLPNGPLALLPLADGRSSLVWSQAETAAAGLLAMEDADFVAELERVTGGVLGKIDDCSERFAFPLGLAHALRYALDRVVLIGDAAHAVHPLAGQGMNLGLRDAVVLADTLSQALERGEHPGDQSVLRRYERAQKAHNLGMQLAFDAINAFFAAPVPGCMGEFRGLSLGAVDRLEPLKRVLMRRAMGLDRTASTDAAA